MAAKPNDGRNWIRFPIDVMCRKEEYNYFTSGMYFFFSQIYLIYIVFDACKWFFRSSPMDGSDEKLIYYTRTHLSGAGAAIKTDGSSWSH